MDFDFETYQSPRDLDFFGNSQFQSPQISFVETPVYKTSNTWLGFRGPNSSSARGSLDVFRKNFKVEVKPEFEDFLNEESPMEREIFELKKKNEILEEEKEKLISELIHMRIKEIEKNDNKFTDEVDEEKNENVQDLSEIVNLKNQLYDSEKIIEEFEKENEKNSEKIFELEMEKQRLTIKLHQTLQQCSNLKDSNQDLKTELNGLSEEKKALIEKLKELEKKIEKIEDGDFEHVEKNEEFMNEVIEQDAVDLEASSN
ncbi:hypothetical protein FO519_008003 [Halicephalobus sp. NKZ332]|nr:hypothetical protein FO519_008003 [Halicephalobus sp. NKZ332]